MEKIFSSLILNTFLILIGTIHFSSAQEAQRKVGVGQKTYSFKDTIRNRELTTEIWYPFLENDTNSKSENLTHSQGKRGDAKLANGEFPLILFSHGTGGGRLTLEWLCSGLAANGFIVAAVDHYGNTFNNPIKEEFVKVWERPRDLSFIIDQVLGIPELAEHIDTTKIGAMGFSLGGFSVTALAGAKMDLEALVRFANTTAGKKEVEIPEMPGLLTLLQETWLKNLFRETPPLKDQRLKAAVTMAPALGQAFPKKENFDEVEIPFLILGVGNDSIAPPETNARYYAEKIKNARIEIVDKNAGHYVFLNAAPEDLQRELPLYFSDPPLVNRKNIHQQTIRLVVKFFQETLQ